MSQEPCAESETEALRRENERLRVEVAYWGKLRALKSQERRRKFEPSRTSRRNTRLLCSWKWQTFPDPRLTTTDIDSIESIGELV